MSEFAGNGKNTVSVLDINDFKRHRSSPVNGIHVATGRAEAGMTAKRDKFEVPAVRTTVHGTAERGITTA